MKDLILRDYAPEDRDRVLALNQAHVPEVGPLDHDKLDRLAAEASWFPVALLDGDIVGFAILFVENARYESTNYGWFQDRHDRFLYVDRIAVVEKARGRGLGQRIYTEAAARARAAGRPVLAAEVNTIPPNEPSMRFHEKFGFQERARRCPYGDDSEVAMLECEL